MTSINNNVGLPMQAYGVQQKQGNYQTSVNFKAGSDEFVRSDEMSRLMAERQKQQKKAKREQKGMKWLQTGALISSIALAGVFIWSLTRGKGDPADNAIMKRIKEKMSKIKNPSIKQQVEAELRMNAHERNLYRAENLIKLDELAQDTSSRTPVDIKKLTENLDNNIIGIKSAKDELITSVKKANYNIEHGLADTKPTIIILDGSPGTSKTTLAKQYADAAGLYFKKIPCGGISDPQSIIGFKRTYMGSVQGAIAEAQVESGTKKVCYCLDEIDRVTKKDVLDTLLSPFEEKAIFIDQYYGVPIDLSQSTFIMTTNDFTKLPEALKNRASIVHIADYTPKEKADIAKLKLNLRIKDSKAADYIDSIDDSIYEEIAKRTNDKGGRQVDLLTEELMSAIKGMQQDKKCSKNNKVKINKAFLDEIKLGENMRAAAELEEKRRLDPLNNL